MDAVRANYLRRPIHTEGEIMGLFVLYSIE